MFSFAELEKEYKAIKEYGYTIMGCLDYIRLNSQGERLDKERVVINRVDVDYSIKKCSKLVNIFAKLGIKGSFFIRTQGSEYNPFSFESYNVIRDIIREGHEIGYHSEIIDCAKICGTDPTEALKRNTSLLESMYDIRVHGIASHGGLTGENNLSFWDRRDAKDLGFTYEAYDKSNLGAFYNGIYVSDSEVTRWKTYMQGKLVLGDRRKPSEHVLDGPQLIYMLIHPENYYEKHIYE